MDLSAPLQLDGWLPIRIAAQATPPFVDWCHVGTRRFTEPFFEQTIEQCLRHPFSLLFRHQTSLDALPEWQARRPGLPPSGFIFHMSRCGSTLIAQMLAALPSHIVISEAPPIDALLRAPLPGATDERRIAWLRGLLSALGQRRNGGERRFFMKFDSWHTLALPLIRRAFPDVPWIFVCRKPVEVMVSQMHRRAAHMVPGAFSMESPGLDAADAARMSPEEYCARVLGRICSAALAQLRADPGGRVVNYTELPEAVPSSLAEYFQLDCTAAERDRMREAAQFDAKTPSMFFSPDKASKAATASASIREMSARWVEPIYTELEALRRAGVQPKIAS